MEGISALPYYMQSLRLAPVAVATSDLVLGGGTGEAPPPQNTKKEI